MILVGEMRDLETMEAAITAAETGHLVFATLHTTGAARTVDRIVDAFPTDQQEQIRTQLSVGIVAVISQLLLVRADRPGRVAAFEIMISTPSIQALIRDNKTYRITSDIQTGAKYGMITLDAHLMALYQAGHDPLRGPDHQGAGSGRRSCRNCRKLARTRREVATAMAETNHTDPLLQLVIEQEHRRRRAGRRRCRKSTSETGKPVRSILRRHRSSSTKTSCWRSSPATWARASSTCRPPTSRRT